MSSSITSSKPLAQRTFNHKGMDVTETVYENGELRKLVWCRDPMGKTVVDGLNNPLIHWDFSPGEDEEQAARAKVRDAFDKHWQMAEK